MKHKTDEAYEVSFNEFGDDPIAVALALLDARHALTLATERAETAEAERDDIIAICRGTQLDDAAIHSIRKHVEEKLKREKLTPLIQEIYD